MVDVSLKKKIILEILLDIRYGYVVMEKIKLSLKGCEKEMGIRLYSEMNIYCMVSHLT